MNETEPYSRAGGIGRLAGGSAYRGRPGDPGSGAQGGLPADCRRSASGCPGRPGLPDSQSRSGGVAEHRGKEKPLNRIDPGKRGEGGEDLRGIIVNFKLTRILQNLCISNQVL